MHPAILIHNPVAGRHGRRRLLAALVRELSTDGPEIETLATRGVGDATALARRAANDGAPIVFALGGDGTVREVAAGLLGGNAVLGVLPAGTTNVVARALGLPLQPLAAARSLKRLPAREIDVGLCGDEAFLMMASLGLDAIALRGASPLAKRWFGRAAVALAGLGAWWHHDYAEFELLIDGHAVGATFAAACNLPLYGGDVRLAPDARPDDGKLDVVLFRGSGRRANARVCPRRRDRPTPESCRRLGCEGFGDSRDRPRYPAPDRRRPHRQPARHGDPARRRAAANPRSLDYHGRAMKPPQTTLLQGFLTRLRFPQLFMLAAGLFLFDLIIPDLLPFVDEILLAIGTLILGSMQKTVSPPTDEQTADQGRDDGRLQAARAVDLARPVPTPRDPGVEPAQGPVPKE